LDERQQKRTVTISVRDRLGGTREGTSKADPEAGMLLPIRSAGVGYVTGLFA
jgi:hypothetical protein